MFVGPAKAHSTALSDSLVWPCCCHRALHTFESMTCCSLLCWTNVIQVPDTPSTSPIKHFTKDSGHQRPSADRHLYFAGDTVHSAKVTHDFCGQAGRAQGSGMLQSSLSAPELKSHQMSCLPLTWLSRVLRGQGVLRVFRAKVTETPVRNSE